MYRQQTDEKLHQSIYWALLGQQKLENEKSNKKERRKRYVNFNVTSEASLSMAAAKATVMHTFELPHISIDLYVKDHITERAPRAPRISSKECMLVYGRGFPGQRRRRYDMPRGYDGHEAASLHARPRCPSPRGASRFRLTNGLPPPRHSPLLTSGARVTPSL